MLFIWTRLGRPTLMRCHHHHHHSEDAKDAESMHSGRLSHVPSESALFPHQDERGDLLGRAKIMPPNIWNTPFTLGNVRTSPLAYPSSSHERMRPPGNHPDAGQISERTCTGQPVTDDGDGKKNAVPNQRFLRSSSTGHPFDPMKGRTFTNCGVGQQRLQIPEPHFDKFPTPQTFSFGK